MKTHTIRKKSADIPIVALTPEFTKKLLTCSEWSVSVTITKLLYDLKTITGKRHSLDSVSRDNLADLQYVFDDKHFMLRRLFMEGLMHGTIMDAEVVLDLCESLNERLK